MRRIGRWLLNAFTVLSLLLCVGACVLWGRSYYRAYRIVWGAIWPNDAVPTGDAQWNLKSNGGTISFERVSAVTGSHVIVTSPQPNWQRIAFGSSPANINEEPHGFSRAHYREVSPGFYQNNHVVVSCPWWFSSVALAAGITIVWQRRRGGRQAVAGKCVHCSYDLTANVSGVCPECGTKIAEAK